MVFHLGRLPGGDPSIFTIADTTLPAIGQALRALKLGGVMATALYYGGQNGYTKRDAVLQYVKTLDDKRFTVFVGAWHNRRDDPPMSILIWEE